ncbi:Polyadenylate-binding protein 4 [Geranomyces michiganensis]|nr:Polyadenylate-binding protein 4 [Geranomyces michiganensis]
MASALDVYPTLYISGMLPGITELDLVHVLNEMQMESKVNFEQPSPALIFRYLADAERFFATINGSMFLGAKVLVTFKDPNMNFSTTSGAKPILCKHIPLGVTSLAFHDYVRPHGRIMSCKVMIDRSGLDAYALLQFENQEAAEQCLRAGNGASFMGATLAMSWQFPKNAPYQYPTRAPSFGSASSEPATTYVPPAPAAAAGWGQPTPPASPSASGVPPTVKTASRPNPNAAPWSPVTDSPTLPLPATAAPIKHAWELPATPPAAALDNRNLYVKNLPDPFTNSDLFDLFRRFGRIASARVMLDDRGVSKGFGFVSFDSPEMAARAIAELNGKLPTAGAVKPLVVNVAEPRGYRQSRLAAFHAK